MTQKVAGTGLASVFVLLAICLLLLERAPPILAAVAVLAVAPAVQWRNLGDMLKVSPAVWAVSALVVWMLLSCVWSIAGLEGVSGALRIAVMIVIAVLLPAMVLSLPPAARYRAARWAGIAICLAIALLLVETLLDMPLLRTARYMVYGEVFVAVMPAEDARVVGEVYYPVYYLANRLNHIATMVAILTVPAVAYVYGSGRPFAAAAIAAMAALGLFLAPSHAPLLAGGLAALAAGAMLVPAIGGSRVLARGIPVLVALGVVATPWLLQAAYAGGVGKMGGLDHSAIHRLVIWDHVAGLVAERPIIGYGIEASRVIGRGGVTVSAAAGADGAVLPALPLHPHNASLQIWLELGAIGAVCFAAFLYCMTRMAWTYTPDPVGRAGLVGSWVAVLTIAHLSNGVWQYWWIACLGFTATMVALMLAPRSRT